MSTTATLHFNNQEIELPVITGTEQESAIDISKLRDQSGLITSIWAIKIRA
jgi:citrate synthase